MTQESNLTRTEFPCFHFLVLASRPVSLSLTTASKMASNILHLDPVGKRERFFQNSFKTFPDAESCVQPITAAWKRKYACCFKLAVGLSSSYHIGQEQR